MYGERLFTRHVEDDEEIIMVVHKHWLLGFKYLLWPIVTMLGSWGFLYLAPLTAIFYAVSLLSVAVLAWIITENSIIDVEWHGWFHRQSTRVLFSDVQGVSYEIQGIFGTMLKFGTIGIEKISTGSVLSLDSVKNPRSVEASILNAMEEYLHSKNLTDAKRVQELLSQIVAREVNLEQFDDEGEENDDEDDYDDDDDEYDDDDD